MLSKLRLSLRNHRDVLVSADWSLTTVPTNKTTDHVVNTTLQLTAVRFELEK